MCERHQYSLFVNKEYKKSIHQKKIKNENLKNSYPYDF